MQTATSTPAMINSPRIGKAKQSSANSSSLRNKVKQSPAHCPSLLRVKRGSNPLMYAIQLVCWK